MRPPQGSRHFVHSAPHVNQSGGSEPERAVSLSLRRVSDVMADHFGGRLDLRGRD